MTSRAPRTDVRLVPLAAEHAPNMLRWMMDPDVARNIGLRAEPTPERTRDWVERATADPACAPFAILLDGRHVGNVVLDRIDRHLETARLSVYVGEPDVRGQGVGAAAVGLAVACAFGSLGLHKVWLTVHVENTRAIATYRRLGFVEEGVLRDEFWLNGRRTDLILMGILRREFGDGGTKVSGGPACGA